GWHEGKPTTSYKIDRSLDGASSTGFLTTLSLSNVLVIGGYWLLIQVPDTQVLAHELRSTLLLIVGLKTSIMLCSGITLISDCLQLKQIFTLRDTQGIMLQMITNWDQIVGSPVVGNFMNGSMFSGYNESTTTCSPVYNHQQGSSNNQNDWKANNALGQDINENSWKSTGGNANSSSQQAMGSYILQNRAMGSSGMNIGLSPGNPIEVCSYFISMTA
ncbi:hypothetical protein ACJX0J_038735, partial [Zea mays]